MNCKKFKPKQKNDNDNSDANRDGLEFVATHGNHNSDNDDNNQQRHLGKGAMEIVTMQIAQHCGQMEITITTMTKTMTMMTMRTQINSMQ